MRHWVCRVGKNIFQPFFLHQEIHLHFRVNAAANEDSWECVPPQAADERPSRCLWCLDARRTFEHVFHRVSVLSWALAEWLKPVNERENLAWSKQAWNGPLDQHQAKPGLDLGKWSRHCSYALLCSIPSPYTSSRLGWCPGLQELHRLNTSHQGLTSGGNLGGAEHAVGNNWGGGIFFLLGGVKSLIYGFHSGPSLQIIPLYKQSNSWMLILQIKLTLAAFVQWGIHQGLPPPQHVSPLIVMQGPASWIPERRAPPWSDLRSPTTIKGLVCQVLGPNLESPVQGSKRKPARKMGPTGEGHPVRGSGSYKSSPWGLDTGPETHTPSQAGTKPGSQKGSKETIALMWQEDLEAKPARMYGSEIMRSDGGGRMSTVPTEAINKGGFAQSKADGWFLEWTQ